LNRFAREKAIGYQKYVTISGRTAERNVLAKPTR
jgi:hypothetical protein